MVRARTRKNRVQRGLCGQDLLRAVIASVRSRRMISERLAASSRANLSMALNNCLGRRICTCGL
jgi:hypothetical protein